MSKDVMRHGFPVSAKSKKGISKKTSVMIYPDIPPCDAVLEAVFSRPSKQFSKKEFGRIVKQLLKR